MEGDAGSKTFSHNSIVEVKSSSEILGTLDHDGKLEGLPFMPEMLAYCGMQIRVAHRAERTCVVGHGFRSMRSAVFLQEARCDGSHHDGCQRGCLLFWKEAWLRPAGSSPALKANALSDAEATRRLTELATRRADRYVCQSTELASATAPIRRWDLRPWMREVFRGELTAHNFLALIGRTLLSRVFGMAQDNSLTGTGKKNGRGDLGLAAGEWVRVKSAEEICTTLDAKSSNRGLSFQPTMKPAVGGRYQVAFPVRRIIIETTGKMVQLENTVALKGVICQGACVAHCQRSEYLYWRESWLCRESDKVPVSSLPEDATSA